MKVIFENFTNFFQLSPQQNRRSGQPAQQPLDPPGQPKAQGQENRAHPCEPAPAPQGHGGSVIGPDRAGPLLQCHPQHGPAHPQPKAEVQHQAGALAGKPAAEDAQQVIACPRPQAQQQAGQ